MKRKIVCLASLLVAAPLHAQEEAALPTVLVVAPPVIQANEADAYAALATHVGAQQVEDLNALDLASALRRTPGVSVSRFNPVGSFGGSEGGAVYIRGFGASRPGSEIKTYLDGVPLYMGVWDHPLLDLLPVNGVQDLTVYKSPQPQNFGNAFAAIDLMPREAGKAPLTGGLRLSGGSGSTFVEQADADGRSGGFDYLLAQGYARSDGHRSHADGELFNVMGKAGYQLDAHYRLSGLLLYTDNRASDPGIQGQPATRTGDYETRATLANLALQQQRDWGEGELKLYYSQGHGNALNQPAPDGDTLSDFTLYGLRARQTLKLHGGSELLAGVDVDGVDGSVEFKRIAPAPADHYEGPKLRLDSPYFALHQHYTLPAGWTLQPSAGLRYYHHNVFDAALAPHAGLMLDSQALSLRAQYARGLHYPGQDVVVLSQLIPALGTSWQQLKPEQDDHYELGASWHYRGDGVLDLALFRDNLQDRYVFAFPPAVSAPSFANLGDYHTQGAEATLQQALGRKLSLFVGGTLLDPSLKSLPYAPKRSLSLGANLQLGDWRLSSDLQAQSSMYVLNAARADGASNTAQVGGFAVLNARLAWQPAWLPAQGELFLAAENLLDKDYAYRQGYPMPGTWLQGGVKLALGRRS